VKEEKIKHSDKKKACANCGAEMKYKPGSNQLNCDYCGFEAFIEESKTSFEELELRHYINMVGDHAFTEKIEILQCKNCGANQHVEENFKSLHCVYCAEPLIIEDAEEEGWIVPGGVLPFQLDRKKATGQRGDFYYENQNYRDAKGNVRTRRVRRTSWSRASGQVQGFIDDILINASEKKRREIPEKVANWNLKKSLAPFNKKYLAGFVTEKYTISLKDGHQQSYKEAKNIAYHWIRKDIGGDTQRVNQADIKLTNETFKHVLLPMYISSYRYNGTNYNFYVNGQTGSISGKHPYSFWKIFFFVLVIIIVLVGITFLG